MVKSEGAFYDSYHNRIEKLVEKKLLLDSAKRKEKLQGMLRAIVMALPGERFYYLD